MNPLIQRNKATVLFFVMLACFGLSPTAQAVTPPPDGGYPGRNTAEGENALFSLTDGFDNTANGYEALYYNTTGIDNTANGIETLLFNTTGFENTANAAYALLFNTTGFDNTANGAFTLQLNTTGFGNTANGVGASFQHNRQRQHGQRW
jgi:hypothetical protein